MTTSTTLESLAAEAASYFERRTRGDDEIVTLKDNRPEWAQDLTREAHGDFLPDDWRYACIKSALDWLANGGDPEAHEWADAEVDIYTGARFAWLSSNLQRQGYCDEAIAEFGEVEDTASLIGMGQYFEAQEVMRLVVEFLEARAEREGNDGD